MFNIHDILHLCRYMIHLPSIQLLLDALLRCQLIDSGPALLLDSHIRSPQEVVVPRLPRVAVTVDQAGPRRSSRLRRRRRECIGSLGLSLGDPVVVPLVAIADLNVLLLPRLLPGTGLQLGGGGSAAGSDAAVVVS